MEADLLSGNFEDEIAAGRVNGDFVRTGEVHGDGARISADCESEVVFQLSLLAVIHEIYAGIDVFQLNAGKTGDTGMPRLRIVPAQVVAFAGEVAQAADG